MAIKTVFLTVQIATSKNPPFEAVIMKQFNQNNFSVLARDRGKEFRNDQKF